MRRLAFSTILFVAGACQGPDAPSDLQALLPGLELRPLETDSSAESGFEVQRFGYRSVGHDWPYGVGISVTDVHSGNVLWIHLHHGDFPPRQVHWADFDGDGRSDAFFHAGFEDVFETHVYLNRVAEAEFAISNFAPGFVDREVYAVVLDLDGDEQPELLLPEPPSPIETLDHCGFYDVPQELRNELADEYRRLAGRFDTFNFRYGTEDYPLFALRIPEEIRIVRLYGGERRVTARFPEHLRWRIQVLERMSAVLPEACQEKIHSTIGYLNEQLSNAP